MTLEEFRRVVLTLSGNVAEDPFVVDTLIQESMDEATEIISCRGGSVGRVSAYIDLTTDRDRYPVPSGFDRVQGVERLDGALPWTLSPVTAAQIGEGQQRNSRGGFFAISGDDLVIWPAPEDSAEKGLRVWGHGRYVIAMTGDEDQEMRFPPNGQAFVMWRTVVSLATEQPKAQRAITSLARAQLTFMKRIEIPHSGVPPAVIKEGP